MPEYIQPDSLNLGLELQLETTPFVALRVSWIRWDSGFRESGLQPGDRIVAIDGIDLNPTMLSELDNQVRLGAESKRWQDAGAIEGTQITLGVQRRTIPGRGWARMDIRGTLRPRVIYEDNDRKRCFGPGGPAEWDRENFNEGWSSWYDTVVKLLRAVLDEGWNTPSFTGDSSLRWIEEHAARFHLLAEKYPGPFAKAMNADLKAARAYLAGRVYTLPADALAYRERGERLVREIADAGTTARTTFLADHVADFLTPLPQIDPILDNHDALNGKLVELPVATNREWVGQGPKTYFTFNEGRAWFFADAESKGAQAVLEARRRYEQRVTPNVRAEFKFIAQIKPGVALVRIGSAGYFGLIVEPVACTVGDAFFVDVSANTFASEEKAGDASAPMPLDTAAPEDVINAFYTALKMGDRSRWESFYSPVTVWFLDDGTPRIQPWYDNRESTWENARRRILDKVCDVQVVWVGDPIILSNGKSFAGAPVIEQAQVVVEHIRRLEDGTFRAFYDSFLRRVWTLQRIATGPWRITNMEGI